MNFRYFEIRSDPRLQHSLHKIFVKSMREIRQKHPERILEEMVSVRGALRVDAFLRFRILHHQFHVRTVPGLPLLVRGARFAYTRYVQAKKMVSGLK
jgi:hypothetical protein